MPIASRAIDVAEPLLRPTLAGVRGLETRLGPDDDWVETDRRVLFEVADRILRPLGRPTIRQVGTDDYVATVAATADRIEEVLAANDYQRNLLSTRKYRTHHQGGRQWAAGSWVLDETHTRWQHHVYLFPYRDERATDVYAHREPSVRSPSAHHGGNEIVHGAAMNLPQYFDSADLEWAVGDLR